MTRIGDFFDEDDTQKLPRRGRPIIRLEDESGNLASFEVLMIEESADEPYFVKYYVEGDMTQVPLEKA